MLILIGPFRFDCCRNWPSYWVMSFQDSRIVLLSSLVSRFVDFRGFGSLILPGKLDLGFLCSWLRGSLGARAGRALSRVLALDSEVLLLFRKWPDLVHFKTLSCGSPDLMT